MNKNSKNNKNQPPQTVASKNEEKQTSESIKEPNTDLSESLPLFDDYLIKELKKYLQDSNRPNSP